VVSRSIAEAARGGGGSNENGEPGARDKRERGGEELILAMGVNSIPDALEGAVKRHNRENFEKSGIPAPVLLIQ